MILPYNLLVPTVTRFRITSFDMRPLKNGTPANMTTRLTALKKLLTRLIGISAVGYLFLVSIFFVFQARLVYFPDRYGGEIAVTPSHAGLDYEDVRIHTEDGETLHGWYVAADNAEKIVLVSHGNAGNLSTLVDTIRMFNKIGLNVLVYDYRGYGNSTGSPDETGTYNDARAAWHYLTSQRGQDPQHIVIFGRSLGAAVAVQLATEVDEAALVLEAPFTSIMEMAATHYPWMLGRHLAWIRYDSTGKIDRVDTPLLIIHSREDQVNPYFMGQELYDLANDPKMFLEISGTHGGGYLDNENLYLSTVRSFLATYD